MYVLNLFLSTYPTALHSFAAEFALGIHGEGEAVLRMLECQGRFTTPEPASAQQLPSDAAGAADLSVKRFSRRRLLQTGGIATRVWTASVLLARWLARNMHSLRALSRYNSTSDRQLCGSGGGRVLELGCGLGVGGIAAAMCGCSVLLTDAHGVALSSCQAAISANADRLKSLESARSYHDGGHVRSIGEFLHRSQAFARNGRGAAFTMELDWSSVPSLTPLERFSCIIAADIVHEEHHAPLVAKVIRVRIQAFASDPSHSRPTATSGASWRLYFVQSRRAQPFWHGRVPAAA
jgi:predicted nicotinamide N-methyase